MSQELANRFAEALRKLEQDRDLEPLVEIHTEDCNIGNVAVPETFHGHDGLREFWTSYRKTFDTMDSEFRNIFADGAGHAALEWVTTATANANNISYDGVSILEIDGDKVSRFRAYFDPRRLSEQLMS